MLTKEWVCTEQEKPEKGAGYMIIYKLEAAAREREREQSLKKRLLQMKELFWNTIEESIPKHEGPPISVMSF